MKRYLLLILSVLVITFSFAQRHGNKEIKWLSLALKGGYGGTAIFNSDVLADKNASLNFLSPSYCYGGRFGITYGDNFSLNIEPLMSAFSQEYNINDGVAAYTKKQKFTSLDYFVSLRYVGKYGFYFELGPQFTTLKSATVENSKTGAFTEDDGNYIAKFKNKYINVAGGLGYAIYNGDRLQVNLGLRGTYALTDFVEDKNYYVLNDGVYNGQRSFFSKSSPFTLKLMVELNYFFGFWGDSNCGKGRLMFFQ